MSDASALDTALAVAAAGWRVFPIRANAKVPLTANGFKDATADAERIRQWGAQWPGCNWAVACGASDLLVVDGDPRNGADLTAIAAQLPRTLAVSTGGGGMHWYFKGARRVPAHVAPGVDLKSEGGYVLLPGSYTAPETRTDDAGVVAGDGFYRWADAIAPEPVPPAVLNAMDRWNPPARTECDDLPEGLELGDTWAAAAKADLATLPAAVKGDGGTPLLRAAAVAIRGWLLDLDTADAVLREVWCPRCSPPWTFDDAADERNWWHTLERARDIGDVEWGSRRPLVGLDAAVSPAEVAAVAMAARVERQDGNGEHAAPAVSAPTVEAPKPPHNMVVQPEAWMAWMNSQYTLLTALGASGKVRIGYWIDDASAQNDRKVLVLQSKDDFLLAMKPITGLLEGKLDEHGAQARTSIAPWWLQRFDRAEARRFCFRPDLPPGCRFKGQINLWRGYGIAPALGDWSLLRSHLETYVARGDAAHFDYILRWMAWVVQNPGKRAEVVLVFKGTKGSGKNTAFDSLCAMMGQHGKAVAHPKHFTGNFNAHLQDCALLFANEAIPPNDKAAEGVLKSLVTDASMPIERKGIDVEMMPNCLSVCMASNERWCVPASLDERRFAVFEIDPAGRRDVPYWTALHAQLDNGGRAAMLHDLLSMRLGDWHPRQRAPKTAALVEQQVHALRGADAVVHQMLAAGENWGRVEGVDASSLPAGSAFVSTTALAEFTASKEGVARRAVDLAKALQKACGGVRTDTRLKVTHERDRWVRGYAVPPLAQAREHWAKALDTTFDWPDVDGWT